MNYDKLLALLTYASLCTANIEKQARNSSTSLGIIIKLSTLYFCYRCMSQGLCDGLLLKVHVFKFDDEFLII